MNYYKAQAAALIWRAMPGVKSVEIVAQMGYFGLLVFYKDGSIKTIQE
jgi:hypothetical protein